MLNIRLQLLCDSSPIASSELKVGGETFTTNSDGMVDLELAEGQHQISLWVGEDLLKRTIIVEPSRLHIILDVSPRPTLEIVVERLLGERYKLKSILGRGGMGVVFKAEDRVLNRSVAIKMLSGELEGNVEAQRVFLEEGRSLAPLVHPNLVAIHDILNIDSHTLMVLEFVNGDDLDVLLKKGAFDEKTAVRYILQMTRAIAFMHSRGFIHRDVKPGNAIVQADGTLKMIDFGLARSLVKMDQKGTSVRGTPAYMSPEQITGSPMSPKVDIYQLGVTLYELLSGELPFSGEPMYAHVHTQPMLLSDKNIDISLDISNIVSRCLSKDPTLRPTADELMEEFQALYLHGDDINDDELNALMYNRITSSVTTGNLTRDDSYKEKSSSNRPVIIIGLMLFGICCAILWAIMGIPKTTDVAPVDQTEKKSVEKLVPADPVLPIEKTAEIQPPVVKPEPAITAPTENKIEKSVVVDEVVVPKKTVKRSVARKRKARAAKVKQPEKVEREPIPAQKPAKEKEASKKDILVKTKDKSDVLINRSKPKSVDILVK